MFLNFSVKNKRKALRIRSKCCMDIRDLVKEQQNDPFSLFLTRAKKVFKIVNFQKSQSFSDLLLLLRTLTQHRAFSTSC